MKANDFVIFALKSPLHVMMGPTMLLTITGRKTRRKIAVPVNYYQDGDSLWVLSSRDRTWWRNLLHVREVDVRLHGHDYKASGDVVLDEQTVAARLGKYVQHVPGSARYVGVRFENGEPNCEDLARVSRERLFIRVCLS